MKGENFVSKYLQFYADLWHVHVMIIDRNQRVLHGDRYVSRDGENIAIAIKSLTRRLDEEIVLIRNDYGQILSIYDFLYSWHFYSHSSSQDNYAWCRFQQLGLVID